MYTYILYTCIFKYYIQKLLWVPIALEKIGVLGTRPDLIRRALHVSEMRHTWGLEKLRSTGKTMMFHHGFSNEKMKLSFNNSLKTNPMIEFGALQLGVEWGRVDGQHIWIVVDSSCWTKYGFNNHCCRVVDGWLKTNGSHMVIKS